MTQDEFNTLIGELDHTLSRLMLAKREAGRLGEANRQHHAEDMIAAGESILAKLGPRQEGLPQPKPKPAPVCACRRPLFSTRTDSTACPIHRIS